MGLDDGEECDVDAIPDFSHGGELCREGDLPDAVPRLAAAVPLVLLPDGDDAHRPGPKTGQCLQ